MIWTAVALMAAASASTPVELRWPGRSRARLGRSYVASLEAEADGEGGIESIQLVLRHRPARRERNLLEPTPFRHGVQPFIFQVWDAMRGPAASLYGADRDLPIHGTRAALRVRVVNARSGTAEDWTGGSLVVRLSVEPLRARRPAASFSPHK